MTDDMLAVSRSLASAMKPRVTRVMLVPSRYFVEWHAFPRNPWVLMDSATGHSVKNKSGHFVHCKDPESAMRYASRLPQRMPT